MKRISRSLTEIGTDYDVIVIGSGYGGGIAASRLARTGKRVCLLERGKERVPGEFPSTLSEVAENVQLDTALQPAPQTQRTGLFNIHMNDDITAVVGCGLGGTSLINANVSLETDPEILLGPEWPEVFRTTPGMLDPYYDRARRVLDPNPYPQAQRPLHKVDALMTSARSIGANGYCPPINVNFVDQVNPFGVYQPACTNCGDCVSGCNYGAKNTTQMNYLPDAHNHGASIFTMASVRYLEQIIDNTGAEGGWRVHIECLDESLDLGDLVVSAGVVVLGAGTLGSTEILLRSRDRGLALSPTLGSRFSGNGDVLAFGYNNNWDRPGDHDTPTDTHTAWSPINGIGQGRNKVPPGKMPGPCIAGIIDMRNAERIEDRLVIEEGVIPGALAPALAPGFFFGDTVGGNPMKYGPGEAADRLKAAQALADVVQHEPGALTGQAYEGPVNRTQTYLVMSMDDAGGSMRLENDRLRIDWKGAGDESVFRRDDNALQRVNDAIHGEFIANPMWSGAMGKQLVTVHPVGGCRMGDDWNHGVVDDLSRVYRSEHETYDGLYVCDGAVLPGSVGVNPLLTISALAERAVEQLASDRGWSINEATVPAEIGHKPFASPRPGKPVPPPATSLRDHLLRILGAIRTGLKWIIGALFTLLKKVVTPPIRALLMWIIKKYPDRIAPSLQFTETMEGWFCDRIDDSTAPPWERISDPFELAAARGREHGQGMDFLLTISMENLSTFNNDPHHEAIVTGTVTCSTLSKRPMRVDGGRFRLLPPDPDHVEQWLMIYDLPLIREDGVPVHFLGQKFLKRRTGSSVWTDLTKLFVTISEGDDATGRTIGRAILTLDLQDLARQGGTLQIELPDRWWSRIGFVKQAFIVKFAGGFAANFGKPVLQAYGGLLADLSNMEADDDSIAAAARRTRQRLPDPKIHVFETDDHFQLKLYHYPGGPKGPVILAPGFVITAASFAIETTEQNIVEHLLAAGYDVWLFAYRGSPDSGSSTRPFTLDDIAQYDWPAAVSEVRAATGKDPQIVAHCIGSMTILMSLLGGHVTGVKSLIASQLTVHPVVNWLNDLKADLGIAPLIRHLDRPKMGIDFREYIDMTSPDSATREGSVQVQGAKTIDAAMWMLPVPPGEECTNPVCHRIYSVFGPAWTHAQLNHATHLALAEVTGKISTAPFQQISDIASAGYTLAADGSDAYLPHVERLKLPIDFLAGRLNDIFLPETSQRTHDWAAHHNGPEYYTRRVFTEYAHMDVWMGRNAHRDIYPYVVECLDRHHVDPQSRDSA